MAAHHSPVLPVVALQLAGHVARYAEAMRELAANPDEEAAREAAFFALRLALPLAAALPAVWAPWGEMVARHLRFIEQRTAGARADSLVQASMQIEDRAEKVMQQCVDWALRRQTQHRVDRRVAAPFFAWDDARREAFALRRQIGADPSAPGVVDRYEAAMSDCRRLLAEALIALRAGAAPTHDFAADPGRAEHEPSAELQRFRLIEQWRVAEEAAADAELGIMQVQLSGLRVTQSQRDIAIALRAEARQLRTAVFSAACL